MAKKFWIQERWAVILLVGFFTMTAAGCEPLRKKFTRKKKENVETESLPVLDPVIYPDVVKTSDQIYQHHYSLWQVWYRDLLTEFQEKHSDKRRRYIISQMLAQLDAMQDVVQGEKKTLLTQLRDSLQSVSADFERPMGIRNDDLLEKQITHLERQLRNTLSPQDVKGTLIGM